MIRTEHLSEHLGFFYRTDRVLTQAQTQFQAVTMVETASFGRAMLLDGVLQVWEANEFLYHELLVHPALTAHPTPERVCVIGAGDGGTSREVLKHAASVDHVELDGEVVELCREWLPGLSAGAFDDPRLQLHVGDGRAFIEGRSKCYDAVIMDMTDPFGPSTALYTREMYAAVKASLRDSRGVFAMHAEGPLARPRAHQQILATLAEEFRHLAVFYNYVQMYNTLWSVVVASDDAAALHTTAAELDARLAHRGISGLHLYSGGQHHAMAHAAPWQAQLRASAGGQPRITDAASTFLDEIDINRSTARVTLVDGGQP